MNCEIYKELFLCVLGISAICSMVVMVHIVYKKNK